MFTGIVQARGTVTAINETGGDITLSIAAKDLPFMDYAIGDSIAVNGVCLTATALRGDGFDTDVSTETLAVTSLGDLEMGADVNLEPALSVGDRLGGHLVSGHVDCLGTIVSAERDARSMRLVVEIPADYARYVAKKGSVCIDGVSLTVNAVTGSRFDLNIIPHTAETTTIGRLVVGSKVNVEVDLLARYLERLLHRDEHDGDDAISMEFLKAQGYV